MSKIIAQHTDEVERINSICLSLFDMWCENRSLVPLCYLMHCWPLSRVDLAAVRQLGETMHELKVSCEELDGVSTEFLGDLIDCVNRLMLVAMIEWPNVPPEVPRYWH
ncbi:hypothetical protein ACT2FY_00630 [Paraburkholderia fungorum]|uniref:hypothetical protein n=1 Tax=Paraburkholderia fungorum TaxID=134537 RepID=UPI00402BEA65